MLYAFLLSFLFISDGTSACVQTIPYTALKIGIEAGDRAEMVNILMKEARRLRGSRYKMGGISKKNGFDCSGLIQNLYEYINIPLPRSASAQSQKGQKIRLDNLKAGDLIFFKGKKKISHVAMVAFHNARQTIIVHSTSSKGVIFEDLKQSKYWRNKISFATRVI